MQNAFTSILEPLEAYDEKPAFASASTQHHAQSSLGVVSVRDSESPGFGEASNFNAATK